MWNCRKCWAPIYYKSMSIDRVCEQCTDSTDVDNRSLQARIAELEKQLLLAQTQVRTVAASLSARNDVLEQTIRELMQCCMYEESECASCRKALALLQPEAGEEVDK